VPDRDPSAPDPYEHAFEAAQQRRLARETPLSHADQPESVLGKPPPRLSWKWIVGALAVALLIAVVRAGGTGPPPLKADCGRPSFALSTHDVGYHSTTVVRWSAAGPPGQRFFLAIGAQRIDVAPNRVQAVPQPGQRSQLASDIHTWGTTCLDHGNFGVALPPGSYTIALYELDPAAAFEVAMQPFTVRR
jgi:hypothetical protein